MPHGSSDPDKNLKVKVMIKSLKIRIYPSKEQEEKIWKHIGSCRFVWNYMIDIQQNNYENGGKYLSSFSMINLLKPLKNDGEHNWLYEVSNTSLQTVCRDLDKAYKGFFKKIYRYPRFKSRKKSKPSYPVRCDSLYFKDEKFLNIEKIGKVRYKTDFKFSYGKGVYKFTNPRISYKPAKDIWMLTFGMECENQTPELTDTPMGIDLGIKDLAIVAFGDEHIVFHNFNKSKKVRDLEKKKIKIQKGISRKYEASKKRTGRYEKTKNIIREEQKLRKIYDRLNGIRDNYIHQTTHKLVSMLPKCVVMEDLDISEMIRKSPHRKTKHISDQKWGEFIRQMKYKCEFYSIPFVQVDRYYPSSKTCSNCGFIKRDLEEKDRVYVCPECGFVIDRDYNAAINLMRHVA